MVARAYCYSLLLGWTLALITWPMPPGVEGIDKGSSGGAFHPQSPSFFLVVCICLPSYRCRWIYELDFFLNLLGRKIVQTDKQANQPPYPNSWSTIGIFPKFRLSLRHSNPLQGPYHLSEHVGLSLIAKLKILREGANRGRFYS
jgi:hypothetical protein